MKYKYIRLLARFRRFVYNHETSVVRFLSTCMVTGVLCFLLLVIGLIYG